MANVQIKNYSTCSRTALFTLVCFNSFIHAGYAACKAASKSFGQWVHP